MKIILPDGSVQEAEDELRAIRHTASHVLAQAVNSAITMCPKNINSLNLNNSGMR